MSHAAAHVYPAVAVGETIYGGKQNPMPAWVVGVGEIADFSLNTIVSLQGAPNAKLSGSTRAWSGCAFAPWWGQYGALIFMGGGHSDGAETWILVLDIATRVFYVLKNSCTIFHAADDNYVADEVTGWMWANTTESAVQVGEPFTSHFYTYLTALPPEMLPGAGADNGWLFTPGRTSMAEPAGRHTAQAHKLRLGIDTLWSLHGSPMPAPPIHGCSIVDAARGKVVVFTESQGSATVNHTQMVFGTAVSSAFVTNTGVVGFYKVGAKYEAQDVYMAIRFKADNTLDFFVVDPVTRVVSFITAPSGTPPNESVDGAFCWVESWNCWVYDPMNGTNKKYTLKCTGNPKLSASWNWASQTLTGTARSRFIDGNNGGIPMNRIRYIEDADTFITVPDYLVAAQQFRITAP